MAPAAKGKKSFPKKNRDSHKEKKTLKRKRDQDAIETLDKAIAELDPKAQPLDKFSDLPLSRPTASGLRASHFEVCTDIQRHAIPLALKGKDILGAARTGSGKTIAFLVPVLEKLFRARWTEYDGLGALVISPTRELAVQIFDVLRKIGRNHTFSAGLVIGGKSLKEEADRLSRMNILVGTPGRILQHLDQTANFNVDNLHILVLDEADRIMDMGFSKEVDALVGHLPKLRQTLLFSATQSKRVSDLARLSLKDPEYVSVHEAAPSATPTSLQQSYLITPLPDKLDTLWAFIRSNLKKKMIVFLSSQKQTRFFYESFRRMQPGVPLLHLHGGQKMEARLNITNSFQKAKYSCLLATDVVARGVDFPSVDWVVQVDVPEDVDTYIHRVGRTARFESDGKAVLFVDPSEQAFVKKLEQKRVPIRQVNVRDAKKKTITDQIQTLCFQNNDLKYLGQKAFISYTKSIYLQRDKEVFKFDDLDLEGYAKSLGLPGTPQISFSKGGDVKKLKNASRQLLAIDSESEGSDADLVVGKKKSKDEVRTKHKKMVERQNQDVLSTHYRKLVGDGDGDDGDDDDFLSVKRVLGQDDLDDEAAQTDMNGKQAKVVRLGNQEFVVDSHRREKMLKSKKKLAKYMDRGRKTVFDDDGNAHAVYELKDEEEFRQEGAPEALRQEFVQNEATRVKEADVEDKQLAKDKRREKREKRKARERGEEVEGTKVALPRLAASDDEGSKDPLALLRSLPMNGEQAGSHDEEEDGPPRKKARKWSQKGEESGDDKAVGKKEQKRRVIDVEYQPETLEDFEALAADLLED